MATRNNLSTQELATKLSEAGVILFRERSGYALSQAQRNLENRTHYVDDSTLKVFDAKILSCEVLDDCLILGIVESIKPTEDSARTFRPVFFDLFGNVIARTELEDSFRTQKQAQSAFWKMADDIDAVEATLKGIKEKQKYLQEEIDKLDDLMKAIR